MSKTSRRTLKLEHWHIISGLLIIYDIIAVNFAHFLALWIRFDCAYTKIPWDYLETFIKRFFADKNKITTTTSTR